MLALSFAPRRSSASKRCALTPPSRPVLPAQDCCWSRSSWSRQCRRAAAFAMSSHQALGLAHSSPQIVGVGSELSTCMALRLGPKGKAARPRKASHEVYLGNLTRCTHGCTHTHVHTFGNPEPHTLKSLRYTISLSVSAGTLASSHA